MVEITPRGRIPSVGIVKSTDARRGAANRNKHIIIGGAANLKYAWWGSELEVCMVGQRT